MSSLTFATGHGLEPADKAAVSEIVGKVRSKNYGFRSLIQEVVTSPTFQTK